MSTFISEENRFTTYVKGSIKSKDYQILQKWQDWFTKRGISSWIARTETGYALYRKGLIPVDPDPEDLQVQES